MVVTGISSAQSLNSRCQLGMPGAEQQANGGDGLHGFAEPHLVRQQCRLLREDPGDPLVLIGERLKGHDQFLAPQPGFQRRLQQVEQPVLNGQRIGRRPDARRLPWRCRAAVFFGDRFGERTELFRRRLGLGREKFNPGRKGQTERLDPRPERLPPRHEPRPVQQPRRADLRRRQPPQRPVHAGDLHLRLPEHALQRRGRDVIEIQVKRATLEGWCENAFPLAL
jgi:hypothetical protein